MDWMVFTGWAWVAGVVWLPVGETQWVARRGGGDSRASTSKRPGAVRRRRRRMSMVDSSKARKLGKGGKLDKTYDMRGTANAKYANAVGAVEDVSKVPVLCESRRGHV